MGDYPRKENQMAKCWCKHYRGMSEKTACEAGVEFSSIQRVKFSDMPCFGPQNSSLCDKSEYPTAEEMKEREAKLRKRFEGIAKARQAIVEACGGPWKKGDPGQGGAIDCPVCDQAGALSFSRSGYNGHIHACCKTETCVRWME